MPSPPNILFIAIDDLRPLLHCYGHADMVTPNIDRLADAGTRFARAYCQVPVCGASRASMFTGLRPRRDRFVDFATYIHDDAPGVTTLPEHLKDHGYHTCAFGKVFHHGDDSPHAWSQPHWSPPDPFPGYRDPANVAFCKKAHEAAGGKRLGVKRGPAFECLDCPDDTYADGHTARRAAEELARLARGDQPFFLGAGFTRPHLPYYAPKRYWDLYDRDAIQPEPAWQRPPDFPEQALHDSPELRRNYTGIPDGPIVGDDARQLIHGYRAAVSYLDANVGLLLDAIEQHQLADNTIVVFFVDHGMNLGEHGLWCKHCLFETSCHVPLIIRDPRLPATTVNTVVENLGIYPTICELTGLATPDHIAGKTLAALMRDPTTQAPGSGRALTRYYAGESVRTDQYRYIEYREADRAVARLLFDHAIDPAEQHDLADDPAHAGTVDQLRNLLPQ